MRTHTQNTQTHRHFFLISCSCPTFSVSYLDELLRINLARRRGAHVLERGSNFVIIVADARVLARLLNLALVEIAIAIEIASAAWRKECVSFRTQTRQTHATTK